MAHLPIPHAIPRASARRRDAAVLRVALGFGLLASFSLVALPAQADETETETEAEAEAEAKAEAKAETKTESEPVPEAYRILEQRWIPSLDTGFETFDYNVDTTVQNFINAPSWAGSQKNAARQLMYRIGGELMGPAFEDLPGSPRLFAQAGAQIRTFSADEIFASGDPGVARQPDGEVTFYESRGNLRGFDLPRMFTGQGSDVFGTFQDPSWYAAFGVAFTLPLAHQLLLQVKPSLEYGYEEIDFFGRLTTVNEINPHPDPDFSTPTRNFIVERSRKKGNTSDHSVGAGLELALVLFRNLRPVRVSLYTEARFMWLVGDRDATFGDSQGVASFSVSRDAFGIRGGGGVRLSWVGFE